MAMQVTEENWRKIDKLVKRVAREEISFTFLPQLTVDKGQSEHKYLKATDFKEVYHGDNFSYDYRNKVHRTGATAKIDYVTIPIEMSRKDIDSSQSYGIESILAQAEIEGRGKMMEEIEKTIYTGYPKGGVEGLMNYTNVLQAGSDGIKALTTKHHFISGLNDAISTIAAKYVKAPYTCIMTPGIASQLRANLITGLQTEWNQFQEWFVEPGLIDNLIVTDRIAIDANGSGAALSTSNQAFALVKQGPEYSYALETYPLHRDGIPQKEFENDVAYGLKWAGCFVPKNSDGVVFVSGLTTASSY